MHWSASPDTPPGFTLRERDRRWRRLRELMAAQHVDLLLVFPQWMVEDALYVANIAGVVIFPLAGEPTLIIGGEDSNLIVEREGWIADRRSATGFGSTRTPYGEAVATRLGEMNVGGQRVAIAGLLGGKYSAVRQPEGYLNYTTIEKVREALPEATILDGTPILGEARYLKSEEEIDMLRQAVRVAEASAIAMVEHARPGVAQAEVFGQMLLAQMRLLSQEPMLAWCPGGWGEPKHRYTTPPPGLVLSSMHVSCEIGPSVRGYGCQIAEPLVVGPVPQQAREIFELNQAVFQRSCELLRPGATWREVEEGARAVAQGTKYKVEFLMHGRGLGNDGPLLIPTDTHGRTKDDVVRANTTFILKPHAFPGELRRDVARSHDVTWGDTVVVRTGGAERLGTRPFTLPVVG
jgi:Xaa-Pro dipeptidase